MNPAYQVVRSIRHILIRKVKFLPSLGHLVLAFVFASVNIVILFTNHLSSPMLGWQTNIASRSGWFEITNSNSPSSLY